MKIGIVGWGLEGQSAYRYFGPEHEYLIVNEEPRDDFPAESDKLKVQFIPLEREPGITGKVEDYSYLDSIESCDKIIYTPTHKGLEKLFPPDHPIWQKTTTALRIFFEDVKSRNLIGVTGTKGKGTTVTLLAKMLETSGKTVHLGGNIGKSVLDFINKIQPDDWVVLELSNFQLYRFPYSPHIAVCLMITEEHLDWHPNFEDYLQAKANIFKHQGPEDVAIYFAKDESSKKIAGRSAGKKIPYYEKPGAYVRSDGMIVVGQPEQEIIHKSDVKLLGDHNLQNICAALTVFWQVDQDPAAAKQVFSTFSGLEHRLEFVRELDGVKYYNDSFATTPDATIVALRAFKEPKVAILGGHDKGLAFDELADVAVKSNIRHAVIVGKTADKISRLLTERGFTDITLGLTKMADIVSAARAHARPGDVVLLSTACASFGLFHDYKDRGNQFKQTVLELA